MADQAAAIRAGNYQDRAEWQRAVEDHIAGEIIRLLPLAIADFNHQIGPRQVERYKGFEEAVEQIEVITKAIAERTRQMLMTWVSEQERTERRSAKS